MSIIRSVMIQMGVEGIMGVKTLYDISLLGAIISGVITCRSTGMIPTFANAFLISSGVKTFR